MRRTEALQGVRMIKFLDILASVARMSEAISGIWFIPACRCAHAGYKPERSTNNEDAA